MNSTLNSVLVAEYADDLNPGLPVDRVSAKSGHIVWWRCAQGHTWRAKVANRANGTGCPFCHGKSPIVGESDLASTHPDLVAQWAYDLNGELGPQQVSAGVTRRVWWRCDHDHTWQATPKNRSRGSGCPLCWHQRPRGTAPTVASEHPGLVAQWVRPEQGEWTPDEVTVGSNRRIVWRCERGHEWVASVKSRAQHQTGCPYCSGQRVISGETDLASMAPMVAAQWAVDLNPGVDPTVVAYRSGRRVWWRCQQGHEWVASVASRTRGAGCPQCAGRTKRETALSSVIDRD